MQLTVGELAKRTGLTVRTLHHYHAIGLLTPSARAENGYRLYGRDEIARLHQIQALSRFGLALAEIGAYLDQPGARLADVISRQLAMLDPPATAGRAPARTLGATARAAGGRHGA